MQTHIKTKLASVVFLFLLLFFNDSLSAQDIWGMTQYGGEYDKGVIFKMDENASNQQVVFSFETIQKPEAGLTEYGNGVFYGMSRWGGKHKKGVIYKFEASNGKFTKILDFDGDDKGSGGVDRMIYASNGKMYGTTVYGGVNDKGVLFEFDPQTESFKKIIDFNGQDKGAEPIGKLVEGNGGKLYGATASGGINDEGVLFSYDISANGFTKVFDFENMVSGEMPVGSLIQLADGKLYGMTKWGGTFDDGLLFSFNPATNQYTILIEFDELPTGSNPVAGLVATPNGKLYGINPDGGNTDLGVLFEYNSQTNTFSKKVDFANRFEAGKSCIAANDGKLYWLPEPDLHLAPWVMGYDPENDTYHKGIDAPDYPRETELFFNSFIQASNNKLYFIVNSPRNDVMNENSLYEYDAANDDFTNYFRFSGVEYGEFPQGSLYQSSSGMLYGTTYTGGAFHQGVVFKIDPDNFNFTKLLDFERNANGSNPNGGLIQADNNKLYGMTSEGGAHDKGVIYMLDPVSESVNKVFDFNGLNGEHPVGDFVKGTNGLLYGVTTAGGAYGNGVLFEFNPSTGSFTKIVDFDGTQFGKEPNSNALVAASSGAIYGTTLLGGLSDEGVLYEYDPSSANFQKLIDFQYSVTGKVPENLIQGSDNMLYSHVSPGFIVKIDPSNSQITKVLDDCDLLNPLTGKLLEASNGKFYGMDRGYIWYRATDFTGGIHEFDVTGGSYSQLMEFSWSNGSNPENTSLIQLKSLNAPVAQCKNITLYLDEAGEATLLPADIDNGSTGDGIELTVSKSDFTCGDAGENDVVLTATDNDGNTATCTAVVTIADSIPPVALCNDIEVFLDASGNAVLDAADVDNGSSDACGIESMSLDVSSFDCQNIGENTVELTVTDSNGNTSSCTLMVTVKDTIAPEVVCHNIEVSLDASGVAEIEAADIDNGSRDACGIESMALNITSFSCENIGENTVELIVTDNNGNSSACTATVTVTDDIAPDVSGISGVAQYLEPFLDNYSVANTSWDAEASDNCTIESLECIINGDANSKGTTLAGLGFVAGVHEIEWLAADAGGNVSSFTSVITIDKRPTTLNILEKEIDVESGKIHVEAVLMDDLLAGGVEGKSLVFTVGEITESAVTDENGVAIVDFTVEDATSDNYTISVGFDEDATYAGSIAEAEIITNTRLVQSAAVKIYPNPYVDKLYVEFTAPESADARIDLYNPAGRLVKNIFNQPVVSGSFYRVEYIPNQPEGNFLLYRMKIGTTVFNGKILNGN